VRSARSKVHRKLGKGRQYCEARTKSVKIWSRDGVLGLYPLLWVVHMTRDDIMERRK
jgi:hypothetical protein